MVICSRDRAELLGRSLAAVRRVMRADDELVVVDSASTDAAVAVVAVEAGARVLRAAAPGLGRARNIGWRAATRPVVAFTDDDCEPAAGWTEQVEAAFTDPSVAVAFGRVVAGDGGGEPLSVTVETQPLVFRPGESEAPVGHGANMACRRAALESIGGFDDELGAGARFPAGEDSDICRRLLRAGWTGVFRPESVVTHRQWRDRRAALRVMYRYGVGAGAVAAKARHDSGSGALLRRELWDEGLLMAARHLRNGYEFGAAACMLRFVGATVGAARARRLPVVDGIFAP